MKPGMKFKYELDMVGYALEEAYATELYKIAEFKPHDEMHEEFELIIGTPKALKEEIEAEHGGCGETIRLSRDNLICLQRILKGLDLTHETPSTSYKVREL